MIMVLLVGIGTSICSQAHNHNYVLYSKTLVYQSERNCREKPYYCTVTVKGYECRYICSCGKEICESLTDESHTYHH